MNHSPIFLEPWPFQNVSIYLTVSRSSHSRLIPQFPSSDWITTIHKLFFCKILHTLDQLQWNPLRVNAVFVVLFCAFILNGLNQPLLKVKTVFLGPRC